MKKVGRFVSKLYVQSFSTCVLRHSVLYYYWHTVPDYTRSDNVEKIKLSSMYGVVAPKKQRANTPNTKRPRPVVSFSLNPATVAEIERLAVLNSSTKTRVVELAVFVLSEVLDNG